MVFDCRPQVLPGAMDESETELSEMHSMTRASTALSQPPERKQSFGGRGDLLGSICPELGVTPLVDPPDVYLSVMLPMLEAESATIDSTPPR